MAASSADHSTRANFTLPVPPAVPENMQLLASAVPKVLLTDWGGVDASADAEASALASYNARYALNGGGKLAPTSAFMAAPGVKCGPSGWNGPLDPSL